MSDTNTTRRLNYLIDLINQGDYEAIVNTWASYGKIKVDNTTRLMSKDTVFQINTGNRTILDGAILYCIENYNGNPLNWDNLDADEVERIVTTNNQIVYPNFFILLTGEEYYDNNIDQIPVNPDYIPFPTIDQGPENAEIQINDSELALALVELGHPFIGLEELEYGKSTICQLCVKPALQLYYRYFPIIKQTIIGNFGANQPIEFKLPPYCFGISRAEFVGNGMGATATGGAFAFLNEQYQMGSGGMGRYGGSKYAQIRSYGHHNTPGYVEWGGPILRQLNRTIAQLQPPKYGSKKMKFRLELNDEDELIAKGYSVLGGQLEAYLNFWSPNFNQVDFENLPYVRKLINAYTLRAVGALRNLVKVDTPGVLDMSGYLSRAKELEDEVISYWKDLPQNSAVIL